MTEFIVALPDQPGSLARFARMLAAAGVNIDALAGWNANGEGIVRLVVNDPDAARRLFDDSSLRYGERPVLSVSLPNRPGALADLSGSLADAGVNIDAIYVVGGGSESLDIAIAVDETESAADLLQTD